MAQVKWRLSKPQPGKKASISVVLYISDSIRPEMSTGEKVLPTNWTGSRVKNAPDRGSINQHLAQIETDLMQLWRDHKHTDRDTLIKMARHAVKGESISIAEKKTVVYALTQFIAQYSIEKETSTANRYRGLLRKLEAFNPNLTFHDLDQNFYDKFKLWLYGNDNPLYHGFDIRHDRDSDVYIMFASDKPVHPIGLFDDVVFKYLVYIQTVMRWSEKRGYPVNPAYKSIEILRREYPIISLTLDELQRIESLAGLEPHLLKARDYLSIACRTGQRISDVKRISSLSISSGIWTIFQKKGSRIKQKEIHLPLVGFCAPVIDIVNNYDGKLPEISEQNLNYNIKEVCKLAGITQEIFIERWQGNKKIRIPGKKYEYISSHSGKRTFITILGGMGVPVKVISDFTGTSIKTIEKHYLGRTELYVAESYLKGIESQTLRKAL